jgi:hypothetical protein
MCFTKKIFPKFQFIRPHDKSEVAGVMLAWDLPGLSFAAECQKNCIFEDFLRFS